MPGATETELMPKHFGRKPYGRKAYGRTLIYTFSKVLNHSFFLATLQIQSYLCPLLNTNLLRSGNKNLLCKTIGKHGFKLCCVCDMMTSRQFWPWVENLALQVLSG